MNILEMIFSALGVIILGVLIWKWTKKPKYLLSFLEPGDPTIGSYRGSVKTKSRYFHHQEGLIDLKKHPEYLRFKEIGGGREYIVEPWKRNGNLYIEEGKTKAVIFEFIKEDQNTVAIPCLRTIETLVEEETNDPLLGYKETYLGVLWGGGKRKMVHSNNLLGIVRYESI